jgi:hypothetical protein
VKLTVIVIGSGISRGGSTWKTGDGCPDRLVGAAIKSGVSPNLKMGMTILCSTVSIQNVVAIWTALALGLVSGAMLRGTMHGGVVFRLLWPNQHVCAFGVSGRHCESRVTSQGNEKFVVTNYNT